MWKSSRCGYNIRLIPPISSRLILNLKIGALLTKTSYAKGLGGDRCRHDGLQRRRAGHVDDQFQPFLRRRNNQAECVWSERQRPDRKS